MPTKSVRRPRVDVRLDHYEAHGHHVKTLILLHQTISPDARGLSDIQSVGHYLDTVGYAIHVINDAEGNSAAVPPEQETAVFYHCQGANEESIGIEQVSYKTGDPRYWWKRGRQMHKTARWIAYLSKRHGIPIRYDPSATRGVCGHADVTRARGIVGGHTDCEAPPRGTYPIKWVVRQAAIYRKTGWA